MREDVHLFLYYYPVGVKAAWQAFHLHSSSDQTAAILDIKQKATAQPASRRPSAAAVHSTSGIAPRRQNADACTYPEEGAWETRMLLATEGPTSEAPPAALIAASPQLTHSLTVALCYLVLSSSSSRVDCTESWNVRERHGGRAAAQEALLWDHEVQGVVPEDLSAPFIPGGGANHADSRTHALSAKVSDRAIKAPTFPGSKGNYPEVHPIDYRGCRRKPLSEIEKEINAIKRQMEAYRVSSIKKKPNVEKEKLQQVFQYSPGSILPRELLPGTDLLDRELSHANALRVGRKPKDRLEQLESMYDLVLDEVEQRKSFMSEMITLGRSEKAAPVEREVLDRMSELRRIHQLVLREKDKDNNSANQ